MTTNFGVLLGGLLSQSTTCCCKRWPQNLALLHAHTVLLATVCRVKVRLTSLKGALQAGTSQKLPCPAYRPPARSDWRPTCII